ncbi:unnamed protein product [Thelazia callipaeda]|uniref:GDE_C domain-containing protein n=1 Tax=Thelazia callipaeda TaxID=103827 RepID=A0A0N5CPR6_THECL|nr:unnamed protein product [Thelazia callipaeda]
MREAWGCEIDTVDLLGKKMDATCFYRSLFWNLRMGYWANADVANGNPQLPRMSQDGIRAMHFLQRVPCNRS